jgi:hypothetical protein
MPVPRPRDEIPCKKLPIPCSRDAGPPLARQDPLQKTPGPLFARRGSLLAPWQSPGHGAGSPRGTRAHERGHGSSSQGQRFPEARPAIAASRDRCRDRGEPVRRAGAGGPLAANVAARALPRKRVGRDSGVANAAHDRATRDRHLPGRGTRARGTSRWRGGARARQCSISRSSFMKRWSFASRSSRLVTSSSQIRSAARCMRWIVRSISPICPSSWSMRPWSK